MATGYRTHDHNGTPNPLAALSDEQLAEIGKEFDQLHEEVRADLSDRDAAYIRGVIALQRRLALLGRVELFASRTRAGWVAGTVALSAAKILENMEIGHNVLHGQWDWMNDPVINSQTWDWDTASTSEAWKHSHNYIHHTYTNILGKDRDLGYEIMRIDPHQSWHPAYLLQPITNVLLMLTVRVGGGCPRHGLHGHPRRREEVARDQGGPQGDRRPRAALQIQKDYIAWPLLSGAGRDRRRGRRGCRQGRGAGSRGECVGLLDAAAPPWRNASARHRASVQEVFMEAFMATVKANVTANVVRNVWSNWIIFCGHFPDQTYVFYRGRGARRAARAAAMSAS